MVVCMKIAIIVTMIFYISIYWSIVSHNVLNTAHSLKLMQRLKKREKRYPRRNLKTR